MGAAVGRETDAVAFLARSRKRRTSYDFYQTLRRLECLYADQPRWGEALRPVDEPVRLGQDPDLSFAPAPLASFGTERGPTSARALQVRLFGLLGPNGPLPLHLTEYARERLRNAGDPTFSRFLDVFHHRLLALFYRAWAQAQPHVNRDRPDADRFGGYVGAFIGLALARRFAIATACPTSRSCFTSARWCGTCATPKDWRRSSEHFFRVPVRIEEFVGHWMALERAASMTRSVARRRDARARRGPRRARLGSPAQVPRPIWAR